MNKAKFVEWAYRPFCNSEEIKRIFNIENSEDYLLKIRAEEVADNQRLFRVIRHRYIKNKSTWNFTNHFSKKEFEDYLKKIPLHFSEKAKLTSGFIFSNDANGSLMRTDYGDIMCISDALRYFLFFMNLSLFDFGIEVPNNVRYRSLVIGIRTMLKTETLDFEQDPRGIIPKELEESINQIVNYQLQFIIGHEYSHYFLNHLDNTRTTKRMLTRLFVNEKSDLQEETFYNHSQIHEFEADNFALKLLEQSGNLNTYYVQSAITFLGYLELYECVANYIFPPTNSYKTHPEPNERYKKLITNYDKYIDHEFISIFIESIQSHKKEIMSEIGFEIEKYEMYGSHYLAEPNTEWRDKELIDRVDFY